MKVIILSAGFGTRLYPLTKNKAKSLLEVKGKPLIDYTINKIPDEIKETIIVSSGKFYNDFLKWNVKHQNKFKIINDKTFTTEERLGGIGDLWLAIQKEKICDDLLIILGDNFFDFDLGGFLEFFKKEKNISVGLHKTNIEEAKKFGVAEVENNKLINVEEKPENPTSNLIVTGFYIIPKEKISLIEDYMKTDKNKEGVTYLIKDWLEKEPISTYIFEGKWNDMGDIETYNKVNEI